MYLDYTFSMYIFDVIAPGFIVMFCFAFSCWLSLPAFYYAFMIPVCVIIITNFIIFILVIKGITCDRPREVRSTQQARDLGLLQVRAAICCVIIMGQSVTP